MWDKNYTWTKCSLSPALFGNLYNKTIQNFGTVRPNIKGIPKNFGQEMKLKWGDTTTTAIVWKEKRNVNILTNMHSPPARGNFCDQHGKALKPTIAQDFVTDT